MDLQILDLFETSSRLRFMLHPRHKWQNKLAVGAANVY